MATSKHAFAKRPRGVARKLKAEEKRIRRHKRKEEPDATIDIPDKDQSMAVE